MRTTSLHRVGLGVLLTAALGCGSTPPTLAKTNTGAEKVAKEFFEALAHADWTAAYSHLDPASKKWCARDQFAQLGKGYRDGMHFVPESVAVSVTETDSQASAVAVFRSDSAGEQHSFRDGTSLKRGPEGWVVVLRSNFGRKSALSPPASDHKKGQR